MNICHLPGWWVTPCHSDCVTVQELLGLPPAPLLLAAVLQDTFSRRALDCVCMPSFADTCGGQPVLCR
jgi:hypothetical protein